MIGRRVPDRHLPEKRHPRVLSSWLGHRRPPNLERHREMERAALAGLTLEPEAAAQQCDEARRNRQTQAGSAIVARRRAVGLHEGLEDRRLLFSRDTDPRIRHAEAYGGVAVGMRLGLDGQDDFAMMREFDGVPDEIREDSAARRFAKHDRRFAERRPIGGKPAGERDTDGKAFTEAFHELAAVHVETVAQNEEMDQTLTGKRARERSARRPAVGGIRDRHRDGHDSGGVEADRGHADRVVIDAAVEYFARGGTAEKRGAREAPPDGPNGFGIRQRSARSEEERELWRRVALRRTRLEARAA
jgi:hypothetical protein